MESNNSIEELIIRYLQNEIQEDELRVLDAWIHESDANKAHFFELKGLFDTRKEVAFLNHYSVERSWERMAGKLDAIWRICEIQGPWQTVLAFILEICGDYRNRYGSRCGYESMDKQSFICRRYGI